MFSIAYHMLKISYSKNPHFPGIAPFPLPSLLQALPLAVERALGTVTTCVRTNRTGQSPQEMRLKE